MAADGSIPGLQLIKPPEVEAYLKVAGKFCKLNLPGSKMQGWFTVGTIVPGGIVHIVEGVGQAWSWQGFARKEISDSRNVEKTRRFTRSRKNPKASKSKHQKYETLRPNASGETMEL